MGNEAFASELILQVITTLIGIAALAAWVVAAIQCRKYDLFALARAVGPIFWLLNFLAYRIASLYFSTPVLSSQDVFLVWAAVIRLHGAMTFLILGLTFSRTWRKEC